MGVACLENILYVLGNGIKTGLIRAVTAVPGHAYDGIIMGYFLAQAKVGSINKNMGIFRKNILLSILLPTLAHTMYDALLFYSKYNVLSILVFFILDIVMVVLCILTVNKTSKIQQNLDTNLNTGVLRTTDTGQLVFSAPTTSEEIHYCPVCGSHVEGYNYCASCGFKIK